MSSLLETVPKDFLDQGIHALEEIQALITNAIKQPIKCEDEVVTPISNSTSFQNDGDRHILPHIKEEPCYSEEGGLPHSDVSTPIDLQPTVCCIGEEPHPMDIDCSIPKVNQSGQVRDDCNAHEEGHASACTNNPLGPLELSTPSGHSPCKYVAIKEEPLSSGEVEALTGSVHSYTVTKDNVLLSGEAKSPPPEGMYSCPVCKRPFTTFGLLARHRDIHNGKKMSCVECGADFCTKMDLVAHSKEHNRTHLSCRECGAKFSTKMDLAAHLREDKHKRDLVSCLECGVTFSSKSDLAAHVQDHKAKRKIVSCQECGADFSNMTDLTAHVRKHKRKRRTVSCKECGEDFPSKKDLAAHVKEHKRKSVQCKECGEDFPSKKDLAAHVKEHKSKREKVLCKECGADLSNEMDLAAHTKDDSGVPYCPFKKTYTCPFCSRTFHRPGNLIRHREHSERVSCSQCNANFCSKAELAVHVQSHVVVFSCPECDLTFSRGVDLFLHRHSHRTCLPCGILFPNRSEFVEHVNAHKLFPCMRCGERFIDSSDLVNHAKVHKTVHALFPCVRCGKNFVDQFALENHVEVHMLFPCAHCGQKFVDQSELVSHVKLHKPVHLLFPCLHCGKQFIKKSDLEEHVKALTVAQVFLLTICSQSAQTENHPTQQKTPTAHAQKLSAATDFPCSDCEKTFPSLSHLIVHKTFHTGEKLPS